MIPYEEVVVAVRKARSPTEGRIYFAALLASAAGVPPDDFIVVGGSAIEFHTVGEYTSSDVDIVSSRWSGLRDVLRGWRFTGGLRVWVNVDLGIAVDLVKHPYTGDIGRTHVVSTPYGEIRVAGIEDLLVKRLASTKHWKVAGDFEHARLLAVLYREKIDWAYVGQLAKTYDVEDVLAVLMKAL